MSFLKKTVLILMVAGLIRPLFVFAVSEPSPGDDRTINTTNIGPSNPSNVNPAPINDEDPYGIKGAAPDNLIGRSSNANAPSSIPELIGSIIGTALSFVGVIFFLLILYAGFLWMTAFGNEEKVTTSKSIMEHAAIGLIIVLSAYAISKFVFGSLPGGGGQPASTPEAGVKGCCFNSRTGNRIEDLESECVPSAANPRTWTAGPCPVLGCCYVTSAASQDLQGNLVPESCTPQETDQSECDMFISLPGNSGNWQQGACAASCP